MATDTSPLGDWATWGIKLAPHSESGNSTIFARLLVDESHISPVDAKRVILIDSPAEVSSSGSSSSNILIIGISLIFAALLGFVALNFRRLKDE